MRALIASRIMPRTTIDLDPSVLAALKRRQRRAGKSLGRPVSELLADRLGRDALPAGEALDKVPALLSRPHVRAPGEQREFWRRYRSVAADAAPTCNLVPDAHLVALMVENEVRTIWSHDRDFRRFKGIEVRDPFA